MCAFTDSSSTLSFSNTVSPALLSYLMAAIWVLEAAWLQSPPTTVSGCWVSPRTSQCSPDPMSLATKASVIRSSHSSGPRKTSPLLEETPTGLRSLASLLVLPVSELCCLRHLHLNSTPTSSARAIPSTFPSNLDGILPTSRRCSFCRWAVPRAILFAPGQSQSVTS